MFIFNNIKDFKHGSEYAAQGVQKVIFDISESQLRNKMNNEPWAEVRPGDIAAIIRSNRCFYLFYVVDDILETNIGREGDRVHVITGKRIAKLENPVSMQTILNKNQVNHPYLPGGQFQIGFNLGNIGDHLDALKVKTQEGMITIGDLKARHRKL